MPQNLVVTRRGRKISGAFIGTDEFIKNETTLQAVAITVKLDKIKNLGNVHPQIATRLVTNVTFAALVYTCRVNPPALLQDAIRIVDAAVRQARLHIVTDPHSPPGPVTAERMLRADMVAALPCRDGGLGHTPLDFIATPAYLGSLAVSVRDRLVESNLHLLQKDIVYAHETILEKIGHDPLALEKVNSVLPPTPDAIVHGGFLSLLYLTNLRSVSKPS
jgi:hypothetical protein